MERLEIITATAEQPGVPSYYHPLVKRSVEYWLSIHPQTGLPGRQHFDPVHIPEILPHVRLIEVHEGMRFKARLVGTALADFAGKDYTGKWFDEAFKKFDQSGTRQVFLQVIASGKPLWRLGKPTLNRHRDFIRTEMLNLPFARDGENIDMLMSVILRHSEGKESEPGPTASG